LPPSRRARAARTRVFRFESGAIAVSYAKTPGSVFFAFPSSLYLVEVFDPEPGRAGEARHERPGRDHRLSAAAADAEPFAAEAKLKSANE
jgi:hypothetical protein